MSAIAWEPLDDGYAVPVPRRPHLVVLPGGGQPAPAASTGGTLRLTRRGRLVLLGLAVLAVSLVVGLTGLRGAGAAEPLRSVTVLPGQTLSEVAQAELPGLSVTDGVIALQMANHLSTAQVGAGQQLVVPRP